MRTKLFVLRKTVTLCTLEGKGRKGNFTEFNFAVFRINRKIKFRETFESASIAKFLSLNCEIKLRKKFFPRKFLLFKVTKLINKNVIGERSLIYNFNYYGCLMPFHRYRYSK